VLRLHSKSYLVDCEYSYTSLRMLAQTEVSISFDLQLLHGYNRARKEGVNVTVCVAAICDNDTIFGAADRMLTTGDIQFEPPDIKIVTLTNSIVVMTSGDSALHAEILQSVRAEILERLEYNSDEWLDIKEVAELYSQHYNEVRRKCAERVILAPFGLTSDTFLERQSNMSAELVKQLASELINFDAGNVEAVVAGIDNTGPHLWVVKNGDIACYDRAGFAAIGAGEWHAKSSFMFARHTRYRALPQTLLLTYAAKKRAEVAPGVGGYTDMFIIGELGSFTWIDEGILRRLEGIYQSIRQQEQLIIQQANVEVDQYVKEIARASIAKEQAALPEDSGGDTPSDQEDIPGRSDESKSENDNE
jgi:20S proteasome alpha/beta subunit